MGKWATDKVVFHHSNHVKAKKIQCILVEWTNNDLKLWPVYFIASSNCKLSQDKAVWALRRRCYQHHVSVVDVLVKFSKYSVYHTNDRENPFCLIFHSMRI